MYSHQLKYNDRIFQFLQCFLAVLTNQLWLLPKEVDNSYSSKIKIKLGFDANEFAADPTWIKRGQFEAQYIISASLKIS